MHALFSVASKLLGLLVAFWGLTALVGGLLAGTPERPWFAFLQAGIAFVFAYLLTLETESLARAVGIRPDEAASFGGIDAGALLRTGIVLIGLYILALRLGSSVEFVYLYLSGAMAGVRGLGDQLVRAIVQLLPVLLALFFVLRPDRVIALIGFRPAHGGAPVHGPD